jgi:hypothetical protein
MNEVGIRIFYYFNIEQTSTEVGRVAAGIARRVCDELNIEYFELPDLRCMAKARWFWKGLKEQAPVVARSMLLRFESLPCVDNVYANDEAKRIWQTEGHSAVGGKDGILVVFLANMYSMMEELGYPCMVGVGEQPTQDIYDTMMFCKLLKVDPMFISMSEQLPMARNRRIYRTWQVPKEQSRNRRDVQWKDWGMTFLEGGTRIVPTGMSSGEDVVDRHTGLSLCGYMMSSAKSEFQATSSGGSTEGFQPDQMAVMLGLPKEHFRVGRSMDGEKEYYHMSNEVLMQGHVCRRVAGNACSAKMVLEAMWELVLSGKNCKAIDVRSQKWWNDMEVRTAFQERKDKMLNKLEMSAA